MVAPQGRMERNEKPQGMQAAMQPKPKLLLAVKPTTDELKQRYGSKLGNIVDEDAWAFEYSFEPEAMEASIQTWSTMLRALGVLPNRSIIEAELRSRQIAMSEPRQRSRRCASLHR